MKHFFSWRDLYRVISKTVLDPVENSEEMRNFMTIALFVVAAVRRQVAARRTELNENEAEMAAVYHMIKEMLDLITKTAELFPISRQEKIVDFIIELLYSNLGYVQKLPDIEEVGDVTEEGMVEEIIEYG